MRKLARIKSKITIGRYKHIIGVFIVALVAALACGVVGALGVESETMHLVNQAIFGLVAVVTAVAGLVFARGFQAAVSRMGQGPATPQQRGPASPVASSSSLPRPAPALSGKLHRSAGTDKDDEDDTAGTIMSVAVSERFSMRFAGFVFRSFRAPQEDASPVARSQSEVAASTSIEVSTPVSSAEPLASALSDADKRGSQILHSGISRVGGMSSPGQRRSSEARVALDTLRAVYVGLAAVFAWGGLVVWGLATGLRQPAEWLAFSACLRVVEVVLVSTALYTVASGRNRFAGTVCCTTQADFALCVWWKCCPCPRRHRDRQKSQRRHAARAAGIAGGGGTSSAAVSDSSSGAGKRSGASPTTLSQPPPPRVAWGSAWSDVDGKLASPEGGGARFAGSGAREVEVASESSSGTARPGVQVQEDAESRAESLRLSRIAEGGMLRTGSMEEGGAERRLSGIAPLGISSAPEDRLRSTHAVTDSSEGSQPEISETNPIRIASSQTSLDAAAAAAASVAAADGTRMQPSRGAVVSWAASRG